MQIRSSSAGELADLLELVEARVTETKVVQAHRQTQLPKQWQQLAVGLGRKTVATQALLETQLDKDAEADLLAMKHGVAGFQLGQSVVHGVSCDRSTACSTETTDHSGCQSTGINDSLPGLASGFPNGVETVDQQLVTQNSGHLNSLLDHTVTT